jgi:predicted permease
LKPDHVIGFSISPKLNGYSAERTSALARDLAGRLRGLPGVSSVTAAELPTLTNTTAGANVTVAGAPADVNARRVRRNGIGPAYFGTLGIPLLAGRDFAWSDDATAAKVAIVNETFARQYFGTKSPLGGRFAFGNGRDGRPEMSIVGVVANSKSGEVTEKDDPFVYYPYPQNPKAGSLTFYLRSSQAPEALAGALRSELKAVDSQLPLYDLKTLEAQIGDSLVTQRLIVLLSASFGALAALLAALGIYGVLAFAVAQRRQEIGVRVALGADPAAVRRLILGEVLRFLVIGAAVGLPAAYALGRAVSSILFGIGAGDPRIFAAGIALLAAVAFAAAFPPAIRAARVNATDALRSE